MKLDRVEIKNFRSIKDCTIDFEAPCRVLVGINECGKSNVLKALRLLSFDYKPIRVEDARDPVSGEEQITKSYIRFIFKLEKADSDHIFEEAAQRVLASTENPNIAILGKDTLSLKKFCLGMDEGLHELDILREKRATTYWGLQENYKLVAGWKKPTEACPEDFAVNVNGMAVPVRSFDLIRVKDFPDIPAEYLEQATIDDARDICGNVIVDVVKNNLPKTLFWEYDESDLLPNVIEIEAFAAKPTVCVPLRNMFVLAGIEEKDIRASIDQQLKGSKNQIQNYLNNIADKTTSHFRQVWKEYRDISFSLRLDGSSIVPGIKETNTHDFDRRSDGFKRFVTFLLMISVQVKSKQMEGTLLLIDEPEISLHPSGARYLRDELIRISKRNYVVYSTHSIFMIDSADIERHYIVKKKDEVTTLTNAEASNLAEEEVLLNALGYSAFEILKEKNLIFEGWKDKRLYEVAIANASAALKKKFAAVGICHARGASSLVTITPLIELAKRDCLVVSDGDGPALTEQKKYKKEKGYGTWLTYSEVDPTITAITGEDFVKKGLVVSSINAALVGENMPTFDEANLPNDNKLFAITGWLKANGMTQPQIKVALTSIKNRIFEDLQAKDIEAEYTKLLNGMDP